MSIFDDLRYDLENGNNGARIYIEIDPVLGVEVFMLYDRDDQYPIFTVPLRDLERMAEFHASARQIEVERARCMQSS